MTVDLRIKNFDYDNYICTIFAPKETWNDISAILNFNIEVATIKGKVSEPMLGAIRLQWWCDAVANLHNNLIPNNKILADLKMVIDRYDLDRGLISGILEARSKDFLETPFENIEETINYISATTYNINKLIFDVLNQKKIQEEDKTKLLDIIKNHSIAYGITALIRSYNSNLKNGRIVIKDEAELQELIKIANERLKDAKNSLRTLKGGKFLKNFAPVLLKGKVAEFYLKQIKRQLDRNRSSKELKITSIEGFGVIKLTLAYMLGRT